MYKRILVALDGSRSARLALDEALKLAQAADAALMVASVVERDLPMLCPVPVGIDAQAFDATMPPAAQRGLDHARDLCALREVRGVTQIIDSHGASIPGALLQAAQAFDADLIVMGTHGRRGTRRHLLGSVAETVLRSSAVPVLMIRDDKSDPAPAF
jgi:nucleotide-binding universal stress UspA family protein